MLRNQVSRNAVRSGQDPGVLDPGLRVDSDERHSFIIPRLRSFTRTVYHTYTTLHKMLSLTVTIYIRFMFVSLCVGLLKNKHVHFYSVRKSNLKAGSHRLHQVNTSLSSILNIISEYSSTDSVALRHHESSLFSYKDSMTV